MINKLYDNYDEFEDICVLWIHADTSSQPGIQIKTSQIFTDQANYWFSSHKDKLSKKSNFTNDIIYLDLDDFSYLNELILMNL